MSLALAGALEVRVANGIPEREHCCKCKENFRDSVADEIVEVLKEKVTSRAVR